MRRSGKDFFHRLVGLFPWRCHGCGGRFYLRKRALDEELDAEKQSMTSSMRIRDDKLSGRVSSGEGGVGLEMMSVRETHPVAATVTEPSADADRASRERTGRLLLVDDDPTTRTLFRSLLEEYPEIEVVAEASDGEEATVLADIHQPDVILMDIKLPRVSGVEATRQIHKNLPKTVIIGVSSQYTHHGYNAMLAAGAVAFVAKEDAIFTLHKTIRFGLCTGRNHRLSRPESLEEQTAEDVTCSPAA